MVGMLCQATEAKKLQWDSATLSGESGYKVTIDGCLLIFASYYDPMVDLNVAQVEFYNVRNEVFYKRLFYENDDVDVFTAIDTLINLIEDQKLLITESKNKIFGRLDELLK